MSKATHAFSAPVRASHPPTAEPTRRAVLTGAAAVTACLPAVASGRHHPAPELETIRARVRAYWEAVAAEISLEGTPGYPAARAHTARLDGELKALAADVFAQPVASWADVAKQAELCRMYYRDGGDELRSSPCPAERALGGLLDAVLAMGARHV